MMKQAADEDMKFEDFAKREIELFQAQGKKVELLEKVVNT